MKSVILLLAFSAAASAQFTQPEETLPTKPFIPILTQNEIRDNSGQYSLQFTAGNGIGVAERAYFKPNADGTGHILVKEGTVVYNSPEGTPVHLTYVADENGYKPEGTHLPQSDQTRPVK